MSICIEEYVLASRRRSKIIYDEKFYGYTRWKVEYLYGKREVQNSATLMIE